MSEIEADFYETYKKYSNGSQSDKELLEKKFYEIPLQYFEKFTK